LPAAEACLPSPLDWADCPFAAPSAAPRLASAL
jgi:hypothetical protein